MGAWGEYDDENDDTCDVYDSFQLKFMEKNFPYIVKLRDQNDNEYYKKAREIMIQNKVKVSDMAVSYLNQHCSKYPQLIAGMAVKIARFKDNIECAGIMTRHDVKDLQLFDGYNYILKKMALEASKHQLNNLSVKDGWKDMNMRRTALEEQIKLFSQ